MAVLSEPGKKSQSPTDPACRISLAYNLDGGLAEWREHEVIIRTEQCNEFTIAERQTDFVAADVNLSFDSVTVNDRSIPAKISKLKLSRW